MKWLDNLESVANYKKSGICPFCGSADTDYSFFGSIGSMGFGLIWCNNCRKAYHMSRVKVVEGFKLNKDIPKGLDFQQ